MSKQNLPHKSDSGFLVDQKRPVHSSTKARALITKNMLYDLENDIWETAHVSAENPDIVSELTQLLDWAKIDIGDLQKRGENARPLGNEPYFTPNELIAEK